MLVESGLALLEHAVRSSTFAIFPAAGPDPGENLDAIRDGVHRPDVELTLRDRPHHLGREIQVADVGGRNDDALAAVRP